MIGSHDFVKKKNAGYGLDCCLKSEADWMQNK